MASKIVNSNWFSNNAITWPTFWKLFSSICIPITIPWLCYRFLRALSYRRKFAGLAGKVVLITGASSGLGESLAHAFYSQGCRVVLAARRKDELERVKNDLLQMHPTMPTYPPVIITLDLAELSTLPEAISSILAIFGHIDILVNNGGISSRGEAIDTSIQVDERVLRVNYLGAVALTKAALPAMLARGKGHIVYVGSIQGRVAIPHRSAYAASKHALQAFCDSLRAEVNDQGVKVTMISPGYIKTNLSMNAVTASGQAYGVMDPTTEKGYSSEYVAHETLKAIACEEKELVISQVPGKLAIYLRVLAPGIYFWVMARRARKLNKRKDE